MANRFSNQDINYLSEQALAQGLGIGTTYAPHGALTSASQRPFTAIQGYAPHVPHVAALQDPHFQTMATQGAYKGLPTGQPTMFSDPYAGLRISSQSINTSSSKPLFSQEVITQASTIDTQKWGLSNFVSQNASMVANPADLSAADYQSVLSAQALLNPPPAHTSKTSPLGQRLAYPGADLFQSQRSTKSPQGQQFELRSQPSTPVSSQALLFQYQQPVYQQKADVLLDNSMNYEAVSPATTPDLAHQHVQVPQPQQGEAYLSLQDLASISSTQQKLEVSTPQQTILNRPSPMVPERHNKMQNKLHKQPMSQQDLYNGSNQMRQSPHQSPIGSPPLQMGSPQTTMTNSNIVQAPPPVQAPADSTTKPKKSRAKKKKDNPVNELKTDNMGPNFSPQTVLNSPEISQRGNGNEYVTNHQHQGYMQSNRTQQVQAPFSSGNLNNTAQNSPLMASNMNAAYKNQHPQTSYAKNVPSPNINHPATTSNQTRPAPQQSPMMSAYQQPSPTHSQAGITYTVSDALEMSRQAVFANQGLMEGFGGSDINSYGMSESFTHQLGIDNMRRTDVYNGAEEAPYMNNLYGGQFVSPNNVLHMDVSGGQSTTIDQDAFSNLMSDSYDRNVPQQEKVQSGAAYSLTVNVEASLDDDLSHLAQPVVEKTDSKKSHNMVPSLGHQQGQSPAAPVQVPVPPAAPKPHVKNASGGTSFMDSFLSFIQGKKPETLSSMSSAIIQHKPQLPKYIPEPPRPRRVEPPPESAKPATVTSNSDKTHKHSVVTFSDSDDTDDVDNKAVQKAISSLSQDNDNVKFSTNKTGGLTMKINLNRVKKAEENAKKARQKKPARPRNRKGSKDKKFGLKEEFKGGDSSGEDSNKDLVPTRQTSTRKAKESKGKYKDDDSDSDTLKPIRKLGEKSDSEAYDSDVDPAWTPFNVENKKPPTLEIETKRKRPTKVRSRRPSKSQKLDEEPMSISQHPAVVELDSGSDDEQLHIIPAVTEDLQVGEFVMEIKDEKNTESYPIWKIESGRMLHKFELFTENSRILHRSIPTFSSWLPNMKNGFKHVRVQPVLKQGEKEYVEVLEEYRPKPQLDSKLEEKYEEHPLVNSFNVYLQIFLSQALEPGFLSAIRETNERFYFDALEKIDRACNDRLNEIDCQVKWREKFKESMKSRPHIRELDRPNLKQSCQACEFASQPAIKSVHLFGNPYDRFTLQEIPPDGPHAPMEFMIGKTGAKYVKPYHNLYHYKYNLFKRCQAKVNILQDGNAGDNAVILDQCLHNRTWVLQLFEDLKQMLEKG